MSYRRWGWARGEAAGARPAALPLCLLIAALCSTLAGLPAAALERRELGALTTEGMPVLDADLLTRVRRYGDLRAAQLQGWVQDGGVLISTRFGESNQIHQVRQPLGARRQLTFFDEPVFFASPQPGGQAFLYLRDSGGSEFYQLYLHDLESGQARLVSDGSSRNGEPVWNRTGTAFAYYSTRRNGRDWDLLLGTPDGRSPGTLLDTGGVGWAPEAFSPDGQQLLVTRYESINIAHPFEIDVPAGQIEPFLPEFAPAAIGQMQYTVDANGVLYTTDRDAEFMQLRHLARISGRERVLAGDNWDVSEFAQSPDGRHVAWTTNEDGYSRLHVRTWPRLKRVRTGDLPDGLIGRLAFSPDGRQLGFTLNRSTAPADVWSVDLDSGASVRWTASETAGLPESSFVAPQLVRFDSFDGRSIPAFVYRPHPADAGAAGDQGRQNNTGNNRGKDAERRRLPVLIDIHGGPEGQSLPGFSPRTQLLMAELGIVVIRPNVRGSNGYGKTWLQLDNGRQREDAVRDIGALLDWIATQPDLDSTRVAVTGSSYGGYMTLAALVHYGARLRAGVEMVGISNFVTFLTSTQDYRRDLRRAEYGDESDPQMRAFLESISPLNHLERITTPLFVAQGQNDPRVPASESRQLVDGLRAAGLPVWYLLAANEGHGFSRRSNSDYYLAAMVTFLREHLLGQDDTQTPPVVD